jgi:hypothetical protein
MWEAFGLRALPYALYGGADTGECVTTVNRVGVDGTPDDWYREWTATADRIAGICPGERQARPYRKCARHISGPPLTITSPTSLYSVLRQIQVQTCDSLRHLHPRSPPLSKPRRSHAADYECRTDKPGCSCGPFLTRRTVQNGTVAFTPNPPLGHGR